MGTYFKGVWLKKIIFFVNWKWNFETSEPAGSNRTTKQRFINMPGAVIDIIITWAETKILKEETKWTVRVLKVFTLSCKLTNGNKNQTQITLVYYTKFEFENKTE